MSISSGVGLISGIPIADLIDQLMAIEARPKTLLEQRNALLQSQEVAFESINAKLLALKFSSDSLIRNSAFNVTTSASSNESVLTASSSTAAIPGSYDFSVIQLAGSQQMISKGFIDANVTPVTSTGTTITIENGRGRLDSETALAQLNGGDGVDRGFIRITDRSGASTMIDLTTAVEANDVVKTINNAASVNVIASIVGDGFELTDASGMTTNNLIVEDVGGTGTATSLGLVGSVATDTLAGADINTIGNNTFLRALNDGNGIGNRTNMDDIRFTLHDGNIVDVNLDGIARIGQLIDQITAASAGAVSATISAAGTGLELTDNTIGDSTFTIGTLNNSTAATDLGIAATDENADGVITGNRILAGINSKLLRNLNGGNGVGVITESERVLAGDTLLTDLLDGAGLTTNGNVTPDVHIYSREHPFTHYEIDIDALTTVQDLIDAFNTQTGGRVVITIEGNALRVTDTTGGEYDFRIIDTNGSTVARKLGIDPFGLTNTQLGVDTFPLPTMLAGTGLGAIDITNKIGVTTRVDLSTAASISDVLSLINSASAGIIATLNTPGHGILLTDTTSGHNNLIIDEVGEGITARTLGIDGDYASDNVDSGNLQFRYFSESSHLADLDVTRGKFKITDSSGESATIDLTQGNEITIADVLAEINSRGLKITATINNNGDGILIRDGGPGTFAIAVEEEGSTTASDLGILGEAAAPGQAINGSLEKTIRVAGKNLLGTTMLTTLNGGGGVDMESGLEDLKITTRDGTKTNINLDGTSTIQDVIATISTATNGRVTAAINSEGTGLTLQDISIGTGAFGIEAINGSSAAKDLGIEKIDDNANGSINGNTIIEITTLEDLVKQINSADLGVAASIINDGSAGAPFRLSIISQTTGKTGAFVFDDGGLNMDTATLAKGRDAVAFFGSSDLANAVVITADSNTLNDVVPGTSLTLLTTSNSPVQVSIRPNDQAVIDSVLGFVDHFNSVIHAIDSLNSYDTETDERGLLLGDPTLRSLRSSLFRLVINRNTELTSQFNAFSQIGITVSSGGGGLDFNETKFRNALGNNREDVLQLFAFKETDDGNQITSAGPGVRLNEVLERLSGTNAGLIQSKVDMLDTQVELNNDRIEQLNSLLDAKRTRLELQFAAMERALAALQTQSQAMAGFKSLLLAAT